MALTDQYDRPIPDDLVVLDLDVKDLTPEVAKAIDRIPWYEPDDNSGLILVSWKDLEEATKSYGTFDPLEPMDADVDLTKGVRYIDGVLHRYNDTDGWYHA